MKLHITIEHIRANGQSETITQEYDQESVIIGRGGKSDVRWSSASLSAEHARFFRREDALFVEDLNSLSGIRVNGRLVQRRELREDDTIVIGDVQFVVKKEGDLWLLHGIRRDTVVEDSRKRIERIVRQLNIRHAYPSMTRISVVLAAIVIVGFVFMPLFDFPSGIAPLLWSSGPVSSAHTMIEHDCQACHAQPFQPVQDESCLACHAMTDHAPSLVDIGSPHAEQRCASCHFEHNGPHGVVLTESKLCTTCHENLRSILPEADMNEPTLKNVADFSSHPQFAVSLKTSAGYERVSLDDEGRLRDPAQIKLNHAIHLEEGLNGPDGPVTMECGDCHRLTPDTKAFTPISYERDCSSCHGLEFDDRLPGVSVPHGDAETVYHFAYAEYAKLFLDAQERRPIVPGFDRFKPGSAPKGVEARRAFARNEVDAVAREAEALLFTKTGCLLCHNVVEKTEAEFAEDGEQSSRFVITKPGIPDVWFPKAHFAHSAHQEVQCESCHEGVRESQVTSDVLLPPIESCQLCHGDSGELGKVHSECILCHSFHDPEVLPKEKRRDFKQIAALSVLKSEEPGWKE